MKFVTARAIVRVVALLIGSAPVFVSAADLVADLASGQPVGTTVTWSVSGAPDGAAIRLLAAAPGEAPRVVYDFGPATEMPWTTLIDGAHTIIAVVRDPVSGQIERLLRTFQISNPAVAGPVLRPTDHPLVFLYSAPPCPDAHTVAVTLRPVSAPIYTSSPPKACNGNHGVHHYVAGFREQSDYYIQHVRRNASAQLVELGPVVPLQSGVATRSVGTAVVDPYDLESSSEGLLLLTTIGADGFVSAVDRFARMVWYYDPVPSGFASATLLRPLQGGTFYVFPGNGTGNLVLREIDLAGKTIRQTTVARVNEQLAALGHQEISEFHHEARPLPDGSIALLAYVERFFEDVQGPGLVDVLADSIVVLDRNLQVSWYWNSFDHMDVTRPALLGEICEPGGPGCPVTLLDDSAADWLHSNAIAYSPADGNLLVSVRHQDWLVAIDYSDGSGDGAVLWRLGNEGDFELQPGGDPSLWLSHTHDPNFVSDDTIAVYDNGNSRCDLLGDCESRGQVYRLDTSMMTATLELDARLGKYSRAVGSAQQLANGNYHFSSGALPDFTTAANEVLPDGAINVELFVETRVYRSFRMPNLYRP